MTGIRYSATLAPQPEGGYTVTFRDFPEAVTEGDSRDEALFNAQEVLSLVLEQRLEDGDSIPAPAATRGKNLVEPSAAIQAALLIRQTREARGLTVADIARALSTSWPSANRLERPNGNPTLRQLERAAAALGRRLVIELSD